MKVLLEFGLCPRVNYGSGPPWPSWVRERADMWAKRFCALFKMHGNISGEDLGVRTLGSSDLREGWSLIRQNENSQKAVWWPTEHNNLHLPVAILCMFPADLSATLWIVFFLVRALSFFSLSFLLSFFLPSSLSRLCLGGGSCEGKLTFGSTFWRLCYGLSGYVPVKTGLLSQRRGHPLS